MSSLNFKTFCVAKNDINCKNIYLPDYMDEEIVTQTTEEVTIISKNLELASLSDIQSIFLKIHVAIFL